MTKIMTFPKGAICIDLRQCHVWFYVSGYRFARIVSVEAPKLPL